jgi:hypothetical protein
MADINKEYFKKAKSLTSDLCPTIGEFVLAFESLCHSLEMGIKDILARKGLEDAKLVEILIGDMTLFPMQNIYRSLLVQAFELDNTEIAIINNIFKRICDTNEERNGILHSAWFIDFKNPDDIKNGLLMKYRPGATKLGAKESPIKYPLDNIRKSIKIIRELIDLVEELNMCIYGNVYIASRFKIDHDGKAIAIGNILDHFQTGKPPVAPVVKRTIKIARP